MIPPPKSLVHVYLQKKQDIIQNPVSFKWDVACL